MVLKGLKHCIQGELFEAEHFQHELVHRRVAHHREMAQQVVIGLEEHRSLLYVLS